MALFKHAEVTQNHKIDLHESDLSKFKITNNTHRNLILKQTKLNQRATQHSQNYAKDRFINTSYIFGICIRCFTFLLVRLITE